MLLQERLNGLARVSLRRIFWTTLILMTLILIQLLKILHQEMYEGSFLQGTEVLYFYLW